MTAVAIVGALSAAGIAAYLISAYRHDQRIAAEYRQRCRDAARMAHPTASGDVVAEAERIVRHAYTSDPTTWP